MTHEVRASSDIVTQAEFNKVYYSDLQNLITETYGHKYSVCASEECGNDVTLEFAGIDGNLDRYEQEKLDKFKRDGNELYTLSAILSDLVRQGKIPSGDYLVRVSW